MILILAGATTYHPPAALELVLVHDDGPMVHKVGIEDQVDQWNHTVH